MLTRLSFYLHEQLNRKTSVTGRLAIIVLSAHEYTYFCLYFMCRKACIIYPLAHDLHCMTGAIEPHRFTNLSATWQGIGPFSFHPVFQPIGGRGENCTHVLLGMNQLP